MVTTRNSTKAGTKHESTSAPTSSPRQPKRPKTRVKAAAKAATVESATDTDDPKPRKSASRSPPTKTSPILEKGIVYFFLRGKVDIEHPADLDQVKRSYIVLRPLPIRGSIDGAVEDQGRARVVAVPKKRLPSRNHEKFLAFVEEPEASLKEVGERFLAGRSYSTKTMGERTDYPAEPVGEGVYAITKSQDERQSHFAYMLTVPDELSEVAKEFGLKEKGSFIVSVKNPKAPAPANAGIADPAEYPDEIMEEFGGLKWASVTPKLLDYKNAQMLFIGEKIFPEEGDHKGAAEELEKLEDEDEERVSHLKDTDEVFAELESSKTEFSGVKVNWEE